MTDSVELEFLGRVPWKVHAVDVHPCRNWIATIDERDGVAIWDTRTNTPLCTWNVSGLSEEKLGNVICVKFVDSEVALACGASAEERQAPPGRWLFASFSNHSVLLEWRSFQIVHFRSAMLDGKITSAAAFCPMLGLCIFGGSDGIVRVVDWRRSVVVRSRLQNAHLKAVTAMAVNGALLFSGGGDGSVASWDLRKDSALPMSSSKTAHNDRVTNISIGPRGVLSIAADRTGIVWALDSGKERSRVKIQVNKAWTLAASPEGWFAMSGKEGGVYRLNANGDTVPLFEYASLFTSAKPVKTYSMAGYSTSSRIVCGTNMGLVVVAVGARRGVSVGAAPVTQTILFAQGKSLIRQKLPDGEKEVVATLTSDGSCEITCTRDGGAVAAYWPSARRAQLLDSSGGSGFVTVYDGECGGVCWAASGTRVAVIKGSAVAVAEVRGGTMTEITTLSEKPATAVFGGPLLGIVSGGSLQFYNWAPEPVGTSISAPRAMAFDADGGRVAFAYPHRLLIAKTQTLEPICSVPVSDTRALMWYSGSVYGTTDFSTYVALPAPSRPLCAVLATIGAPAAAPPGSTLDGAVLCAPSSLPPGQWAPVGFVRSALVLADQHGALTQVPIRSPALRAALLCAADHQQEAQAIFAKLRTDLQMEIAQFVAARSVGSLEPPALDSFAFGPRAKIISLLAARRFAEAARLVSDLPESEQAEVCSAIAKGAAAAGEPSVAHGALDRLHALDPDVATEAAVAIGGDVALDAAVRWDISVA